MHVDGMQERIDRLENLVTSLISQSQGPRTLNHQSDDGSLKDAAGIQSSSRSDSFARDESTAYEQIQQRLGFMKVSEDYSLYRGATHWSDVLEEVRIMLCAQR